MKYILCEGDKIIRQVDSTHVPSDGQSVYEKNSFGWWYRLEDGTNIKGDSLDPNYSGTVYKYLKSELYNNSGVAAVKSQTQLTIELISYYQEILSIRYKPIMEAILYEMVGSSYSQKTATIPESSKGEWFAFMENVGKFQENGFNADNYTTDSSDNTRVLVSEEIFGTVPTIPPIYQKIIDNMR